MKVGFLALVTSLVFAAGFPLVAMGGEPDADADGIPDGIDNCPTTPNPGQANGDGDAAGDACDSCSAKFQLTGAGSGTTPGDCDTNADGYGNGCDMDVNNDGFQSIPDLSGFILPSLNMTVPPGNPDFDLNCDAFISIPDLSAFVLPQLNTPIGPSGKACAVPTVSGGCP